PKRRGTRSPCRPVYRVRAFVHNVFGPAGDPNPGLLQSVGAPAPRLAVSPARPGHCPAARPAGDPNPGLLQSLGAPAPRLAVSPAPARPLPFGPADPRRLAREIRSKTTRFLALIAAAGSAYAAGPMTQTALAAAATLVALAFALSTF